MKITIEVNENMKLLKDYEEAAMRVGKSRGSYLPVLSTLVPKTYGAILELGVGFCSTPYLHWACFPTKRKLVSYENNPDYYTFAESWKDTFHHIHCITDWDAINISEPWSIAFIDHAPHDRRGIEAGRLLHAEYVIVHDSENSNAAKYGLNAVFRKFKYRYKYTAAYPYTSVWSNFHDLSEFSVI